MTIQAAIVSEDTFALDSRNLYLPGLITYEDGPAGSFVLTVTPIGSTDLKIGVIEVIIGSADLQALRAMRDQHTDDDIPELSTLSTNCYDCRTNGERLATIERRQERDAVTFGEHARRLDAIDDELADQTQRLSVLEQRLKQIDEHSLVLVDHDQRLEALESDTTATSPSHRHDGGHWITCPFCADDLGRNCVACDGTQRIWEMPREDGA